MLGRPHPGSILVDRQQGKVTPHEGARTKAGKVRLRPIVNLLSVPAQRRLHVIPIRNRTPLQLPNLKPHCGQIPGRISLHASRFYANKNQHHFTYDLGLDRMLEMFLPGQYLS